MIAILPPRVARMTYVVQPSVSQYFADVERTVMPHSDVLKLPPGPNTFGNAFAPLSGARKPLNKLHALFTISVPGVYGSARL